MRGRTKPFFWQNETEHGKDKPCYFYICYNKAFEGGQKYITRMFELQESIREMGKKKKKKGKSQRQ